MSPHGWKGGRRRGGVAVAARAPSLGKGPKAIGEVAAAIRGMRVPDSLRRPVVALGCFVAFYVCWQILHFGPASAQTLIGDALRFPVDLAATVMAWRASQRMQKGSPLRRAWRLLAIAAGFCFLGDLTYAVYDVLGTVPYPSLADVAFLALYPFALAGLLSFPRRLYGRREAFRLRLDLAVVMLAAAAAVFYLMVGPDLKLGHGTLIAVFSVAYPIGDLLVLLGLIVVIFYVPSESFRLPFRLLLAGLVTYASGDIIYAYVTVHNGYQGADMVNTFWVVGFALVALAAAAQQPVAQIGRVEERRERLGVLPVAAVIFGFGLLIGSERHDSLYPETLTIVACVLALMLTLRLYLGQHDLLDAQGDLKTQALHDALTGLPNRILLDDRLGHALARCERDGSQVAVMLLDIDDFKLVNDTLGHAVG